MMLPLAMSSILSFLQIIQQLLTSYSSSSRHLCISFNNVFQKAFHTQDMTDPVSLSSVIVCRMFFVSLSLRSTSFFTPSVQLIFSILLQHHIPKLSRYPSSTFRNIQLSGPYEAMFQTQNCITVFLKVKPKPLVKRFFLLNADFVMATLDLICPVHLASSVIRLAKCFKHSTFTNRPIMTCETEQSH